MEVKMWKKFGCIKDWLGEKRRKKRKKIIIEMRSLIHFLLVEGEI